MAEGPDSIESHAAGEFESAESHAADAAAPRDPAPEVPAELIPDIPEDEVVAPRPSPLIAMIVAGLALVLVVGAAYFGFRLLSSGASGSRARIETTIAFTEAMLSQNTAGLKKLVPSESLKKVSDAQWSALEQSASKPSITFEKVAWSGQTAKVKLTAEGQEGQITATADQRATDTVTLVFSGKAFGATVPGSCVLVREGAEWKVAAFTIAGTTLKFDPANISKTMGAK